MHEPDFVTIHLIVVEIFQSGTQRWTDRLSISSSKLIHRFLHCKCYKQNKNQFLSLPASVVVSPSKSQHFNYEKISVSCEQFGPGEWNVWRYTSLEKFMSQCGSGWGFPTLSACEIKTAKTPDSGVYWCESKNGDSSNGINITVTDGPVILQSPVLPVMEGDDVSLHCKTKTPPSNLTAAFYKNGSLIRTEPTGHMTIHHVSRSDEGLYKCHIGSHGESPSSWLFLRDNSAPASLTPSPNSAQLFEYKNLSLSCGHDRISRGWTVKRAVHIDGKLVLQSCPQQSITPDGCLFLTVKVPDSGIYWCESPAWQRSNSVKISVHGGPVILQSPVLPVMEGDDVSLHCKTKTPPSNLTAAFYKDGSLIRTEPTGHMTIHNVSTFDEGLYKCHIGGHEESPSSWLFVRDPRGSSTTHPTMSWLRLLCHLVVFCPYCISTVLMVSLYRHRSTAKTPPVSMVMAQLSEDDEGSDPQYDDV
uniref:Ig-like domain-containing protein n=1 Tax=Dicentrarchus labrax TaxID=13489 RepID=A0A8P4GFH3_DICLA